MSSPRLRIGFVGAGFMGQCAHLRNYASFSSECEIVALAELRPGLGREVCARYGIPHWHPTAEDLLASEKVDALVVSQQFGLHGRILPPLARAGVPVFCEKPIGRSLALGETIAAAFEAAGTWLMVGYHKRCDPATVLAKETIDTLRQSGELGRLRYVRITMPPGDWIARGDFDFLRPTEDVPSSEPDAPPADLDAATAQEHETFVNYYIHQVNLLRHLLGEDYTLSYADPAKVLVVGHSESGVTGVIEMEPYRTTVDWQETALATFENGYVNLRLPAPLALNRSGEVEIFKDPGHGAVPTSLRPELPMDHAMRCQARRFLQAVRGDASVPCGAREAIRDLEIARDYFRLLKGI